MTSMSVEAKRSTRSKEQGAFRFLVTHKECGEASSPTLCPLLHKREEDSLPGVSNFEID